MLFNQDLILHLLKSDMLFWILFLCMLLMVEIGWRTGTYLVTKHHIQKADSSDTFLASIFGLLALLVAITFSGASDRFDHRRELIVQEVSSLGTAYQSIDLLVTKDQPKIRELFREYLDARINLYQPQDDVSEKELGALIATHNAVGDQIWKEVVRAVGETPFPQKLVAAQILPELSDMFTAYDNQRLAVKFHPPRIVFQALIILCMVGSLVAGYNLGIQNQRDWLLTVMFVILMTGTIFIIFGLEFPRLGKVNFSDFEIELIALRNSF